MSILDCYKQITEAFNFSLTDESALLTKMPTGTEQPTSINGRLLVMPTTSILRKGLGDTLIAFHPLSESMAREATSEVQKRLQKQAKAVIGHMLLQTAMGVMSVLADPKLHNNVPVKQAKFLKELSDLDKATEANLCKLMAAAMKRNKFVTVYLKSGGVINGDKMNRITTIHFPIISDLQSDEQTIYGVKLTKKQKAVAIKLFEMLVPNGADHNEYSVGSNSRVAPYFTSFVLAYHKVMKQLNANLVKFGKICDIKLQPVPLYEEEIVEQFAKIYEEIPPQRYNIGGVEEEEEVDVPWNEPVKATVENVKAAKAQTPAPKTSSPGTVSVDEFLATMRGPQGPQYQPQQQFQPQNQFQPQPWMPMQQQVPHNPFQAAITPTVPVMTNVPQVNYGNPYTPTPVFPVNSGLQGLI